MYKIVIGFNVYCPETGRCLDKFMILINHEFSSRQVVGVAEELQNYLIRRIREARLNIGVVKWYRSIDSTGYFLITQIRNDRRLLEWSPTCTAL